MHFMYGHGSIWPMILMVVFWIGLLVIGFYLIAKYVNGDRKQNPEAILKERLAKGEIDEEEYVRLKTILKD
ncbi:SHOCT domain-containing protein [Oceanobacillus halotolerans]|uniref:SHOCT domain-containing protein n=1 Tax=Oceanobacillus halotolerans TaxID=2663380 RepID=UPI0013DD66C2|nr:SHOCT domain-containing protein [Oceanobacillus halotolerans]